MPDKPLQPRVLRQILRRYGVWEESSRGKGSHTMFFRNVQGQVFSYPVPMHGNEINRQYVTQLRKRFKLRTDDGVTDDEFYA